MYCTFYWEGQWFKHRVNVPYRGKDISDNGHSASLTEVLEKCTVCSYNEVSHSGRDTYLSLSSQTRTCVCDGLLTVTHGKLESSRHRGRKLQHVLCETSQDATLLRVTCCYLHFFPNKSIFLKSTVLSCDPGDSEHCMFCTSSYQMFKAILYE